MNFERVENRIWWVFSIVYQVYFSTILDRCFPHIVNLACHYVERVIDQMKYGPGTRGALVHVTGNPVNTLHTLIKVASRLLFFHGKGAKVSNFDLFIITSSRGLCQESCPRKTWFSSVAL